ncbi:SGNH/GDSL hydrolase family protein [Amycolatopsis nigrescens]|uniref:SGNH/GDSL hydrolase family protein n=1 Tax=Amycolatopsis nigrescens TaxID=381445 RepID=UPI00035C564C|nr:SGNH/GDSL hydrolase family protein [Amycolatopsis nigrescens]
MSPLLPKIVATCAAVLCVAALPVPAAAAPAPASYVALGDSYSSGPGIPEQRPDSGPCARSTRNYPSLVAGALAPAEFRDVSCSGAVTGNMTGPQGTAPPQFDALGADTELVTLGIGGNDAGFASIVFTCAGLGSQDPAGKPCTDHYTKDGVDQIEATFAEVAPKVAATLQGIHERAPKATVVLVGYQTILPDAKADCAPGNRNATMVAEGDLPYLTAKERSFAAMLSAQAAANGALFVDSRAASVGHDACRAPGTRWIEGIYDAVDAAPVHPNALGMENVSRLVLDALSG